MGSQRVRHDLPNEQEEESKERVDEKVPQEVLPTSLNYCFGFSSSGGVLFIYYFNKYFWWYTKPVEQRCPNCGLPSICFGEEFISIWSLAAFMLHGRAEQM